MERLVLKPDEAAKALGISRSKVYELIHSGELPSIRVGFSLRIPIDVIRELVGSHRRPDQAA